MCFVDPVYSYHKSCKVERIELKYTKKRGATIRFVCFFEVNRFNDKMVTNRSTNKQANLVPRVLSLTPERGPREQGCKQASLSHASLELLIINLSLLLLRSKCEIGVLDHLKSHPV